MTDKFSYTIEVKLVEHADHWRVAELLHEEAVKAVSVEIGQRFTTSFSGLSDDGKHISRGSATDLKAAFAHNNAKLNGLNNWIHGESGPTLAVWLHGYFGEFGEFSLQIISADRLIADRVAKRLLTSISGSADLQRAAPTAQVQLSDLKISSSDDGDSRPAVANGASASASQTPHGDVSWLKRTWRDHAAALVVSVVGGLAVAGAAAWAGFGGG